MSKISINGYIFNKNCVPQMYNPNGDKVVVNIDGVDANGWLCLAEDIVKNKYPVSSVSVDVLRSFVEYCIKNGAICVD